MNVYATLYEIKEELGLVIEGNDDSSVDDRLLRRKMVEASRLIDTFTGRRFYPEYATYNFDHPVESDLPLLLDRDLLSVSSMTTENGSTTITSSNYFLMAGDGHNRTPYNMVALNLANDTWLYDDTKRQANQIVGIWGYHNDWSNAWGHVDDVQDNPLSDSDTSLTVANGDGVDERGIDPRFQIGQLIRFGASSTAEYAWITDIDDETLTITRGVNGSTAAEQAQNTDIYVYRPQFDISQACMFLAVHLYRRKDSIGSLNDQPVASTSGILLSASIPREIMEVLRRYKVLNG